MIYQFILYWHSADKFWLLKKSANVNQIRIQTGHTPASQDDHHHILHENTSAVLENSWKPLKGFNTPRSVAPEDSHIRLCTRCDVTAICFEPLQPMFAVVKMWYMTAASILRVKQLSVCYGLSACEQPVLSVWLFRVWISQRDWHQSSAPHKHLTRGQEQSLYLPVGGIIQQGNDRKGGNDWPMLWRLSTEAIDSVRTY